MSLLASSSVFAVEGYDDIYLDKQKDIVIHGIVCATDLNDFRTFKPSFVYTNTTSISKGTYYYQSPYGGHSYTFKPSENSAIVIRGLLKGGKTDKKDMVLDSCVVSNIKGIPKAISKNINKTTFKANDSERDKKMELYYFGSGKPAIAKGVY